jgi:signal transduction histidine kinase
MLPLVAREALDSRFIRVNDSMSPCNMAMREGKRGLYAVFGETDGRFLGIVTSADCVGFPLRIFADLLHNMQSGLVTAETSAEDVFQRIEQEGVEALPVLGDGGQFLGVVSRQSLLEALLQRGQEQFAELVHARDRLRAMSWRFIEAQENERRHLARELHDEVGQILTGLKLTLAGGAGGSADQAKLSLDKAQGLVSDLMVRVRDLSLGLRPSMLDDMGLLAALLWHFERYTAQTQVHVVFEHGGLGERFAPEIETAAYRIVQEALTNVARHAGVDEVTVSCSADADALCVQILDRGVGFDPGAVLASRNTGGLTGMCERAELLDGRFTLESAPGKGTRVIVELPLQGRLT